MRRKVRIIRIILTEIILMALGILCCIMPMPWRLVIPIIIGTRSIILKAYFQLKKAPPISIEEGVTDIETFKGNKSNVTKKQSKKTVSKKADEKAVRKAGKAASKTASKTAEKKSNKKAA